MSLEQVTTSEAIKWCCAEIYGTEWAQLLIGDSMHPGGKELTERSAAMLELDAGSRVLDVAAGRGTTALILAQGFGCEVIGIDLSANCMPAAPSRAVRADAEFLPFDDCVFDAVICECAFCTFPDKARAAREMARVLKPGGRLGLSDLVLRGDLPPELRTLAGWVACVADARPESEYVAFLESAGLRREVIETHDAALMRLVEQIRSRLLGARLLGELGKIRLTVSDLDQAAVFAKAAESAVQRAVLGYALLTAAKPFTRGLPATP